MQIKKLAAKKKKKKKKKKKTKGLNFTDAIAEWKRRDGEHPQAVCYRRCKWVRRRAKS
jgi:hypothetical protein